MRRRKTNPDYTVGYGKPPEHSRFKKGRSGNPTGRRRYTQSARAQQIMRQELFRRVTVREGNNVVHMPVLQAIIRGRLLTAAKGKSGAAKDVFAILKMIEAQGHTDHVQAWLSHEEALEALDQTPTKIVRTIVDPNQDTDLNQLSEPELADLERLLLKARKPRTTSG
jgi:Family of unknown function (DUF5681)